MNPAHMTTAIDGGIPIDALPSIAILLAGGLFLAVVVGCWLARGRRGAAV